MQGEPFLVYAPSRTPTIPTVYVRCPRCLYTISLCLYADSQMIGLPRTATLGHEFFNKKLIRDSRRMDAVAAKSDAVTAWKCTTTDACRRLRTLTDDDSRCVAFAPSTCDRVKPYPSVTGPHIKFILPEFLSYLGEGGAVCGKQFTFLYSLMNMYNITFQVLRLSTFVFTKCSEKNLHDYICG